MFVAEAAAVITRRIARITTAANIAGVTVADKVTVQPNLIDIIGSGKRKADAHGRALQKKSMNSATLEKKGTKNPPPKLKTDFFCSITYSV